MSELSEKWYTLSEAEEHFRVPYYTLGTAIRKGTLSAKQIPDSSRYGYHYLISESALYEWVEDRNSVKEGAVKKPSEMTVDDLSETLHRMIQSAYEKGYKEGKKDGKKEIMDAIKGVK